MTLPREHEPWVRYRDTGLHAVPSIHYRQVFAQLVFEACARKRFEVIAVELPPSYNLEGMLDAGLRFAPAPTIVMHDSGREAALMRVPKDGNPHSLEMEWRWVKRALGFPITPCDSIVMALRCPRLLAARWPGWAPEIVLIDGEYPEWERPRSRLPLHDDYEVMVHGLAAFQERLGARLEVGRSLPIDDWREQVMACRLRKLIEQGKEVLFVCGAAHWEIICGLLDSGPREPPAELPAPPPERIIHAALDPAEAWLCGWLDDMPRVCWEMELACQRGAAAGFEKRAAVEVIVRETFTEALAGDLPTSIRRLQKMQRYTETLTGAAGRWIPELDGHLVPAAEACVEDRFAEMLKKKALEFPAPAPEGIAMARVVPFERNLFLFVEGEVFLLEIPQSEEGSGGQRRSIPMPAPITERERAETERTSSGLRDSLEDAALRYLMDERVRELAKRPSRVSFSRRFTGAIADGPDWRRTTRALARGEDHLYVKQTRMTARGPSSGGPVVAPVAWILKPDCAAPDILAESLLVNGETLYIGIHYVESRHWIAEDRILVYERSAFVDLGASRGFLGNSPRLELTPEEEIGVDSRYFAAIPAEKRCTIEPALDADLFAFRGTDHALACAIKYARDEVIVVSRSNLPISPQVQRYARSRQVAINRISIDYFAAKRLARLKQFHWVPRPIDTYHRPYEWCSRFVAPI